MDDQVVFPEPDAVTEARRQRELDGRLRLLGELARIASERATKAEKYSRQHKGWWQEGWHAERVQRLHALARVFASAELEGLIRGSPALRRLFCRDMPAIPPRRTGPPKQRKPKADVPVKQFLDLTDPALVTDVVADLLKSFDLSDVTGMPDGSKP